MPSSVIKHIAYNEDERTLKITLSAHFDHLENQCGAEDFIAKPFNIDHFLSRITQQIDQAFN